MDSTDVTAPVLAARTTEESGGGGGGKKTAHVQSGPNGGQFTSDPGSKKAPPPPRRGPAPKRNLPAKKPTGSQVAPIKPKRKTLSRKGPNDPAQVKQLQALLRELKISGLSVDGNFGGDTEAAVKAVQEKLGLSPTGRCSASLLSTLEKVHALSPCVVRASSQVLAAEGPVGYDDDEVLDKVEVAPGRWVCAHADGTVSMRMAAEELAKWAGGVLGMAAKADGPGKYVTARASYPGQRYRHGWIPIARTKEILTEGEIERDYGEILDQVEFMDDFWVAAHEGTLTIHSRAEDPDKFEIDSAPDADTARTWADRVEAMANDADANAPDDPPVSDNGLVDWTIDDGLLVGRYPTGDIAIRHLDVDDEDYQGDTDDLPDAGFDMGVDEARVFAEALRDMADEVDDAEPEGDEATPVTARRSVRAAAGKDTTLGNDELHHWWVYGKGRSRWRTWTELRDQLVEHVGPVKAAIFASKWFHERYGYWSGSDLNRVKHGKPPRGEKVGPG